MKLMYFCNDLTFFLNHFSALLSRSLQQGYDVIVLSGGSNTKDINKVKEEYGARLIPINITRSGTRLLDEFKVILDVHRIIKKEKPEIVHLFTIKPCIYGGIVSRILGIKTTIGTVTGLGYTFSGMGWLSKLRSNFFVVLYRLAFGLGNGHVKLVFENSDDRSYFIENHIINEDKTAKVWGAGVDLNLFFPADFRTQSQEIISEVTVMLPSRMLKDKGVLEFIEAAKIIKDIHIPIRMVLVGGVDPHNPASFTTEELNVYVEEGIVEWLGFKSDMPTQLRAADIVCLPSYREGMPKVLLESMACGKPIITTNVPGCREVIVDGVHGFLIPARDGQSLADAIINISSSQQLMDSMGKSSRHRALQLFSDLDIAEQYINLYKNSLHE
ncbi:glycosyltransferase family 4 protein [Vibrio cholerae]|uniref:glycosyltransferase family 4 protein n=1 Tax=Vibrio cholerae TaxID=666 RepID=UPI0016524375|nr:glycosyltransferase family 4 protein [Vibrio cholerae]BCN20514.1 putative glycosyltransferase [Vibrio cholerae]GIB22060.1 glycosyltransferase family 1 protein [Vibrio cholerae]